jgi:hypothetical protein
VVNEKDGKVENVKKDGEEDWDRPTVWIQEVSLRK